MEEVLSKNGKVVLDVTDGANNLMYLPIDQLMKQTQAQMPSESKAQPSINGSPVLPERTDPPLRAVDRERRVP